MDMTEMANELLEGTDWEAIDDCTLSCPCGDCIEWDGRCDECGPSPLTMMGLI